MRDRGGLVEPVRPPPARDVVMCQRSEGKPGARLGKTTGWIHRAQLKNRGVRTLAGCKYLRIDDEGLHIEVRGEPRTLAVDNVVICAGQVPVRALEAPLSEAGITVDRIGGADEARELEARRAIDQGTRLAAAL